MLRIVRHAAWGAVAILGFLVLAVAVGWVATDGPLGRRAAGPGTGTGTGILSVGGPFALTDHRGRAVTERDFLGRPSAVFFGFTHCPDVCPTTLADMGAFMEALGADADRLDWLFFTVDPERDTPEQLARYLEAFDPRIVGLTGTEEGAAAAARAWRIYYRKVPLDGGGYTMDHSALVFLMDAAGRFAGTIDREEPPHAALEKLRMLAVGRPR